MRTLLFNLVISAAAAAWPLACHARTVVSKSTREPIAYASVGVINRNLLTSRTRFRYASQSDWETLPFGAPVYIGYDTVE